MSVKQGQAYLRYIAFAIGVILVGSVLSSMAVGVAAGTSSNLALDGSADKGCGYVTTCNISLTTTQSNDVIIVGCNCWPVGASFSVKDTAGLTFLPRTAQLSIGGNQFLQEWYAIAPSPLAADSISVQTTLTGETWYGVIAFGVSGANTASPFDSNPALPRAQANIVCSNGDPCNTGVSTTNAVDFVFQLGGDTGYGIQTAGAGFTLIQSNTAGQTAYAQYKVTSSPLSLATLSFGTSQGWDFGVITDAIQPSPSSTSSSSTSSSTTSTTTSTTTSVNPPSFDGSAKNGCGYVTSCSVLLTTTHPSDVIIVGCNCWPVGASFSVKDTAGLTFLPRTAQLSIGGNQFLQEWYAIAPSPLTGDSISVQTPLTGETWYGVIAFGVSGANLQSPFDSNPSLPRTQANINCLGSHPCNTGVSTTNAADFVFQLGGDTGYSVETAGTGFTLIQSNTGGQTAYAQYEIISSSLSSATLSFGTSQGWDFGVIADAIQPGSTSSLHTTTSVVTPNPASVATGSKIVFTATVTDTASSPSAPTGTVTWNDGGAGGSFGGSSACTLSSVGSSSASCQITYTASSSPGLVTISASYAGDSVHAASAGSSALTVTSGSTGNDWPSFTLNNQDSRYQANSTITSSNVGQITQKWVIDTPLSITSTPVTLAGNVYFADWGGNVYSASISNGHLNWKVNLGSNPITSTLALANGMVYVSDGINTTKVFALSQTDGHTVWATSLHPADGNSKDSIWASPILYNGMIYIGVASNGLDEVNTSQRGEIFALNSVTGSVVWGFVTGAGSAGGDGVWGSVAIDPALNSIYFATGNPYGSGSGSSTLYGYAVVSLDATTGALKWFTQVYTDTTTGGDQDFGSSPNLFSYSFLGVVHNAVGIGNKDGSYYIFDRVTGQLLQKIKVGVGEPDGDGIIGVAGFIYQSPNNPEIFVPSYNEQVGGYYGVVKAITPSNGAIAWQFNTQLIIRGSVSVIPGAVLFGDESGNIYAVSTSSGTQLWHTSVAGSTDAGVTAAEGMIFVSVDGSGDGSGGQGALYAFG